MASLSEYYIHMQGKQHAGMLAWADTKQFTSMWVGYKNGDVEWLDPNTGKRGSVEHQIFRDGFFVLTGFDQWSADATQAEMYDINTGATYSLTPRGGHQYSPLLVPRDPWGMRVWGKIAGGPRLFYWQSEFYPGVQVSNPCWHQGPIQRDCIKQMDAWWDSVEGWTRATADKAPFDGTTPARPKVASTWEVTIAKDLGVFTTRSTAPGGRLAGVYSTWDWS